MGTPLSGSPKPFADSHAKDAPAKFPANLELHHRCAALTASAAISFATSIINESATPGEHAWRRNLALPAARAPLPHQKIELDNSGPAPFKCGPMFCWGEALAQRRAIRL